MPPSQKRAKKRRGRTPGKASSSGAKLTSKRTSSKSKALPATASLEVRVAELRRLTALGTLERPLVYISAHLDGSAVPLFSTDQCAGGVIHQWPHGGKKFAVSISDVLAIGEGQKATFEVQGAKASRKKAAAAAAVTDASSGSNDGDGMSSEDDADATVANDEEVKTAGDAAGSEEGDSEKEEKKTKVKKGGPENEGGEGEASADGATGGDDAVSSAAEKAADSSAVGDEAEEEEEEEGAAPLKKETGKGTAKLNAASGRYGVFVPGRVNLTLLVLLAKGKKKKPNAKADTLLGSVTWDLTREARRAKSRRPRMDGAFDIAAESANPFAWQPLEQPLRGKFAKDKFRDAYMTEALSPELLCELSYHPPLLERRNALPLSGASKVGSFRGTRCERLNDNELRKVAQEFYREFDKRKAKSDTAVHRLSILLRENEENVRSELKAEYAHKGHADIFRFFPGGAPLVENGRGADGSYTRAREQGESRVPQTISLELSARGLRKSDLLSKSDPYVAIYAGRWSPTMRNPKKLAQTNTVNNSHTPQWAPLSFKTGKAGNIERSGVTLVVRDDDGILNPHDDYLGSYFLEFEEMMEADALECELMYIEGKKKKTKSPKKKKKRNAQEEAVGNGTITVTLLVKRGDVGLLARTSAQATTPIAYHHLWIAARKAFLPEWKKERSRSGAGGAALSELRSTSIGYVTRLVRDIFELHTGHVWEGLLPPDAFIACVKQLPRAGHVTDNQFSALAAQYAAGNDACSFSRFIARVALESLGEGTASEASIAQLLPIIDALRLAVHVQIEEHGGHEQAKRFLRQHMQDFLGSETRGSTLASSLFGTTGVDMSHLAAHHIAVTWCESEGMNSPLSKARLAEFFEAFVFDLLDPTPPHKARRPRRKQRANAKIDPTALAAAVPSSSPALRRGSSVNGARPERPASKRSREERDSAIARLRSALLGAWAGSAIGVEEGCRRVFDHCRIDDAPALPLRDFKVALRVQLGGRVARHGAPRRADTELTAEDMDIVADRCDLDGDGTVDLDEFIAVMTAYGGARHAKVHAANRAARAPDPRGDALPVEGMSAIRCTCARRLVTGGGPGRASSAPVSFVIYVDGFEVHRSSAVAPRTEAVGNQSELMRGPDAYAYAAHLGRSLGIASRSVFGAVDARGAPVTHFEQSERVWRWGNDTTRADFEWPIGSSVTIAMYADDESSVRGSAYGGVSSDRRGGKRSTRRARAAPAPLGSITLPAPPPAGTRGAPCWLPLSPPGSGEIELAVSTGGGGGEHGEFGAYRRRAASPLPKAPDTEALRILACLPPPVVWGAFERCDPSGEGVITFAALLDAMRSLPLPMPSRFAAQLEEHAQRTRAAAHTQLSVEAEAREAALQQWVPALAVRFQRRLGRSGCVVGHFERESAETQRSALAWIARNPLAAQHGAHPPNMGTDLQRVNAATRVDYVRLCREVEDHAVGADAAAHREGSAERDGGSNAARVARAALIPLRSWARDITATALLRCLQREDRDGSGKLPRAVFRHALHDLHAPVAESEWRGLFDLFPAQGDASAAVERGRARGSSGRSGRGSGESGFYAVDYGAFARALFPSSALESMPLPRIGGVAASPAASVRSRHTALSNGTFIELPRTPSTIRRAAAASAERRPNHRGSPPGFEHLTVHTREGGRDADVSTMVRSPVRPQGLSATFASPLKQNLAGQSSMRAWECGVCSFSENAAGSRKCKMCRSARNRNTQHMGASMALSLLGGRGDGGEGAPGAQQSQIDQCLVCGWEEPDSSGTGTCCMCGSALKRAGVASLAAGLAFDSLLAPAEGFGRVMDSSFVSLAPSDAMNASPAKSPFAERGPGGSGAVMNIPAPMMVADVVPVPEPVLRTPQQQTRTRSHRRAATGTHAERVRTPAGGTSTGQHRRAATSSHSSGGKGGGYGARSRDGGSGGGGGSRRPPLAGGNGRRQKQKRHRRAHSDRYLDGGSARKAKTTGSRHVRSVSTRVH